MPPVLEIDLLRTLIAIADTGSFTQAGREVLRTQSAVSLQMKKLEATLGRALFRPDGRKAALTDDGRALVSHARRILRAHQEAVADFAEDRVTGSVRLGTPDDYAGVFLPLLLSRFAADYPRIHVDVRCEPSPTLRKLVKSGTLDLAILSSEVGSEEGPILRREPVVWIAAPDRSPQGEEPLPLALFNRPCIFHDWALKAMGDIGRRYRVAYTSSNLSALQSAVTAGLAVGVMAESSCSGDFRLLRSEDGFPVLPQVSITLVQSGKGETDATQRLMDHIIRSFGPSGAADTLAAQSPRLAGG